MHDTSVSIAFFNKKLRLELPEQKLFEAFNQDAS